MALAAGYNLQTSTTQPFRPGGHIQPPYYADFFRENLYPNLYVRQLGTKITIPANSGEKIRIPKWTPAITVGTSGSKPKYAASKTGISAISQVSNEGESPTPVALSAGSLTGQVIQFYGARGYTDRMAVMSKADFMEEGLESLARELAYDLDKYAIANISANSVLKTVGNASSIGATAYLRSKHLILVPAVMDAAMVPRWEDETFVMLTHPLAQYDLFNDISANSFVQIAKYGERDRIYKGEIGQIYGVRLLLSNIIGIKTGGSTSGTTGLSGTVSGVNALVFSPDSFYSLEVENGGVEVIHQPLGSSGAADPAAQRGTIATKVFYGVVAAPQAEHRMLRYAHTLSLIN